MSTPVVPVVPWCVGTKTAIARAIAVAFCEQRGRAWDRLTPSMRDRFLAEAMVVVDGMARDGVVAVFAHEWREPIRKG